MSVDSDDQKFNNKGDDANGSLLVNSENMKYTYCDSLRKNQCVDKNGNSEVADNLNSIFYTGTTIGKDDEEDKNINAKKQIEQKSISRLQAMAMSDDEDYGMSLNNT